MESKVFSIGDIVALKSHPFVTENTSVIVSGDQLALPPLMVVTEIAKSSFKAGEKKHDTYKYDCTWFSPKSFKFELAEIYEDQLKLIQKTKAIVDLTNLDRGTKVNFKTVSFELVKKKSELSYDDNSVGSGAPNTAINALLSFLPPVLQCLSIEPYKSKHPKGTSNRLMPETAIRVTYFDPINQSVSECPLPLEFLELIEEVSDKRLAGINKIILKGSYLLLSISGKKTIIRPKNIAHRSGYYFLRGYDYLTNRMEEFDLTISTKIKSLSTPILAQAPTFDILTNPESATAKYMAQEILNSIDKAIDEQVYVRIKYINNNDHLTQRTVRNIQLVTVKEDTKDVIYMIGFCLLRCDKRNFRTDRIQSIQLLNINYKSV